MLGDHDANATVAVKDIGVAKRFYSDTLGLKPLDSEEPGVLAYKSGSSTLFVYESEYAGTNRATAVTWVLDDVDGVVEALQARGVIFERYDLPGMTHEGNIHVAGSMRTAWFKDPDGNVLAVVSA